MTVWIVQAKNGFVYKAFFSHDAAEKYKVAMDPEASVLCIPLIQKEN